MMDIPAAWLWEIGAVIAAVVVGFYLFGFFTGRNNKKH